MNPFAVSKSESEDEESSELSAAEAGYTDITDVQISIMKKTLKKLLLIGNGRFVGAIGTCSA